MRFWAFPDWSGDFRLEPDGDAACTLTVEHPTPAEVEKLGEFLKKARGVGRRWIGQHVGFVPNGKVKIPIAAPLAKAGRLLLGERRRGTITAVVSRDGEVTAVLDGDAAKAEREVAKPKAAAAATVRRPTTCCPHCVDGPDLRASAVLEAFLTPRQRADWQRDGVIRCYGNLSGRLYEVAHRHHPDAVARGKIAYDVEDGSVVHAYDWSVPPAEEVLALKLALEHAEDWVRNPSGWFGGGPCYPNPFGLGAGDGTADAAFMVGLGDAIEQLAPFVGAVKEVIG